MPVIISLIVGVEGQSLVRDQVGTLAAIEFVDTMDELERAVTARLPDLVLTDLRDRFGTDILPTLAALRGRHPSLPLVLCPAYTPSTLMEVGAILAHGLGVGVLLRGYEHVGLGLRPLLAPRHAPSAGETLVRRVVPLVSVPLKGFFTLASAKAAPHLTVLDAARWSGLERRSLERRLQAERLPSAHSVLGACVGLHVAWWLSLQGWSVKQVIAEMGFTDAAAVARPLRRHFDCTPRTLQTAGGFNGLLRQFEMSLAFGNRAGA